MANKANDLLNLEFGRLKVIEKTDQRNTKGCIKWLCLCSCGNKKIILGMNLLNGSTKSCGCLAKELFSIRGKALKKTRKICIHDGCQDTTEKGSRGYCGKHSQRIRRYGDPNFVKDEETRRINNRESQLKNKTIKETTYKKYLGKHEHRVVVEKNIGRKLTSEEVIHHIDGNRHNNSLENLQILSKEEHSRIHRMEQLNANS